MKKIDATGLFIWFLAIILIVAAIEAGVNSKTTQKIEYAAKATMPDTQPNDFTYSHVIKEAIRNFAMPDDISFSFRPPTYERIAPPLYEQKLIIKVDGIPAFGYAKVQFNGGNPEDLKNWSVIKCYIDK